MAKHKTECRNTEKTQRETSKERQEEAVMKHIILGKMRMDGIVQKMQFEIDEDELCEEDGIDIEWIVHDYLRWSDAELIGEYKIYENELSMDMQMRQAGAMTLFDLDGAE